MEEAPHDLHIHSQPNKIKCGAPLEGQKMHYIPKYSRERIKKRQSSSYDKINFIFLSINHFITSLIKVVNKVKD